jgi:NADPH:quinone reductase-like Zn-dependent oxidoreductase
MDTPVVIVGHGAVGRAALALARSRSARVVVAVRDRTQAARLRDAGVDTAELAEADDFAATVTAALGEPAEVVFDTTGAWLDQAVGALADGGRAVVIAAPPSGRVEVPVLDLYRRGGSIIGVNSLLRDSVSTARALDMLRIAFDTGSLPRPDTVVERPLTQAAEIYRAIDAGARGKFVLTT